MAKLEEIDLSPIEGQCFVIGRKGDIFIDDETVSRRHAELSVSGGRIHLRDLDSKNGTYLVTNNKMSMFEQGVVSPLQTVLIGDRKYLVAELLQFARRVQSGDDATTLLNSRTAGGTGRKASGS